LPLARRQITVALEAVLDCLGDIRLAPNCEPHFHSGFGRGLDALAVTFVHDNRGRQLLWTQGNASDISTPPDR
jgi:hypothetical protein